ncbi:MAG: helix-turn-helix domain-containing protein [Flavobacteriales bacterium]|nr:helix-turn-helix domain-containing protein [Flavobacteriales bacterium]
MSAVWEYGPTDSTQRFVLLALADNASDDGGNAYPSIPEIARKCALSKRTVIRALDALVKSGYLIRRRRQDTSNMYQIILTSLVSDKMTHPVSDKLAHSSVPICHIGMCQDDTPGGDTVSPKPSINHPINHPTTTPPKPEEVEVVLDAPVLALAEHFATKAGIVAGVPDVHASMYQDYWKPTLSAILNRVGGDEEMARVVVDASIAFCWGKGTNTSGKTYPLSNPHSIRNIYINRASELSAHAVTADDDSIWQRAIQAITRRDYSDERLKAAIRAIGGSDRIATANGKDTDYLKRNLGNEYRRISAPV